MQQDMTENRDLFYRNFCHRGVFVCTLFDHDDILCTILQSVVLVHVLNSNQITWVDARQ